MRNQIFTQIFNGDGWRLRADELSPISFIIVDGRHWGFSDKRNPNGQYYTYFEYKTWCENGRKVNPLTTLAENCCGIGLPLTQPKDLIIQQLETKLVQAFKRGFATGYKAEHYDVEAAELRDFVRDFVRDLRNA